MQALALLAQLLVGAPSAPTTDWSQAIVEWTRPHAPFRIAGNLYYVGTGGIAAYLLTGPKGHILVDGALAQSAKEIAGNIRTLGFNPRDVRYLLINHAHFDHAGGLAELKRLTGAQLLASARDKADLEAGATAGRPDLLAFPPVKVDRVIGDGQHIRLAAIDLVAHLTPGHTKGCTSWSFKVVAAGQPRDAIMVCSITVANQSLTGGGGYPDAAADFRTTFAKLRRMRADIFLSFHPAIFDMDAKYARLRAGDADAFVDPQELPRRVDAAARAFELELAQQRAAATPR